MTSLQEAKLNMYRTVGQLLDDNITAISPIVAFLNLFNAYKARLSTLVSTVESELKVITGITQNKKQAKINLSSNAADIAAIVFAYASATKNYPLREQVNFQQYELERMKDDLLAPAAQNIHDAAQSVAAALTDYGLTAPMLSAFQTNINTYQSEVPKPRNAKSVKETYTKNIASQVKEMDRFLKEELDKGITIFKSTEPDLVSSYQVARIIIDPARTTTQLKGIVSRAGDQSPLKAARIEVVGPENFNASSNMSGEYLIKPATKGIYTVTVSLEGYQPVTIDEYRIKMGRVNTLDITLALAV